MNSRRSFFKQLSIGAAAFGILPAATTYERIWKPVTIVPVPYCRGELTLEFLAEVSRKLEDSILESGIYYLPTPNVFETESLLQPLKAERDQGQYA